MQSGRWRGHRARLASVYGLIPLGINTRVGAVDIWRKRNVTVPLDGVINPASRLQSNDPGAALGDRLDGHVESVGDVNVPARAQLAAGMDHRLELARFTGWSQQ